jgi:hypothetical protein
MQQDASPCARKYLRLDYSLGPSLLANQAQLAKVFLQRLKRLAVIFYSQLINIKEPDLAQL